MATNIPSTPADGNIRTVLVPTVADRSAPTLAEVNAASAVDISCYLTSGGFAYSTDQATIADERECTTEVFGQPGRKTRTLSITGIDNTNNAAVETAYNELAEILVEGQEIVAIRRRGKAFDAPFVAGDKVSVIPFKPGVKSEVAAEANSVTRSMWAAFITGDAPTDVEIVAGTP